MLELVCDDTRRDRVHEAGAADIGVDDAARIGGEQIEVLTLIAGRAALRGGVGRLGEEIAPEGEAADVGAGALGRQLVHGACEDQRDMTIAVDIRRLTEGAHVDGVDEGIEASGEALEVRLAESLGIERVVEDQGSGTDGDHARRVVGRARAGDVAVDVHGNEIADLERAARRWRLRRSRQIRRGLRPGIGTTCGGKRDRGERGVTSETTRHGRALQQNGVRKNGSVRE